MKAYKYLIVFLLILFYSCNNNGNIEVVSIEKECDESFDYSFLEKDINSWILNKKDVKRVIKMSEPINQIDLHHLFYDLPCFYKGIVKIRGVTYDFELNAASYIWLHNSDTSFFQGCSSEKCSKFFLIQGGDVKRDLDVHSDD